MYVVIKLTTLQSFVKGLVERPDARTSRDGGTRYVPAHFYRSYLSIIPLFFTILLMYTNTLQKEGMEIALWNKKKLAA